LVESLIGSKSTFNEYLNKLKKGKIGFICCKDYLLPLIDREEDTFLLKKLKEILHIKSDYNLFCGGTMFFIHSNSLIKLKSSCLEIDICDSKMKTGSVGTMIHAIERIFTMLCIDSGYSVGTIKNHKGNADIELIFLGFSVLEG